MEVVKDVGSGSGALSLGEMGRSLVRTETRPTEGQCPKGEGQALKSLSLMAPVPREQAGTAQSRPGSGREAGLGIRASQQGIQGCILQSWPKVRVVG